MNDILQMQQKIVPEIIDLMEKRYTILRAIYYKEPIGRRTLASQIGLGERIVRTEVNFLKNQGLIDIDSIGMTVTPEGENIIDALKGCIHELKGLALVEDILEDKLGLAKVVIVPGNIDDDPLILKEAGRAGANYVKNLISDNQIIAVTGGSSVRELVNSMPKMANKNNLLVVPARGGMGKEVSTQANTIAANLANRLNANYRLLHMPDIISQETLDTIIDEPIIKDIISNIEKTDLLIFGIGRADEMFRRRGMKPDEIEVLRNKGAVAEAFGYYFDKYGNVVDKTSTIGVKFEDVSKINTIVAIAGGKRKAEAIMATKTHNKNSILVTDEGAAREIVRLLESSDN